MSSSTFIEHVPCDACGSSDANAIYDDGHTYCFACETTVHPKGSPKYTGRKVAKDLIDPESLVFQGIPKRKLTEATCSHFKYGIGEYSGKAVQVAPYYDAKGNMVAQKLRFPDKTFALLGSLKEAMPFGSHLWPKTGKKLVVTEGEIDCLTMSQVQGNKWPVVSVPNGAQGAKKTIAQHRDYFMGFDEVILMFDNDEPGRKAAEECAKVLAGRAKIADLPLKDANEMLQEGRVEDLVNAMWRAQPYRPEGIVEASQLLEKVLHQPCYGLSWWSDTLTKLTYGIRTGELIALGAGTGIGKTDILTQQIEHFLFHHKVDVGAFFLEQGIVETAKRVAGKHAHKRFHVPDAGWTQEDLKEAWRAWEDGGKLYLYDSFGANTWEAIREKIEFLAHAHGVSYYILDHLTALAAAEEDERVALERIMADMGALVKKLDITIIFVSHLATPEKGSHEEGARVTIRQFKGSRAIGYWSSFMIGLERNQQSPDEEERHTTTVRILKDRHTGQATGVTFKVGYDATTGLLYEKQDTLGFDVEETGNEDF